MSADACPDCPCPAACLRWPGFCRWAAERPTDPTRLRHICERSAAGAPTAPVRVDYGAAGPPARRCCPG